MSPFPAYAKLFLLTSENKTNVNPQEEAVGGMLAQASSGHFSHSTGFVIFFR